MQLLKTQGVLLEICPTSNLHTRAVSTLAAHPVRRFYDFGIPIAIGDDDPITSRTQVSNELMLLKQEFGFTMDELREIQQTTMQKSFLPDSRLAATLQARMATGGSL